MKLSENTINVLKNFSQINPSLVIKAGNVLKTISPVKTVFSVATVEEKFPTEFAIYDLTKFLGSISLFTSPEIEFGDKYYLITEGKQKMRFAFADPSVIVTPPEKELKLPTEDVKFEINANDLQRLLKSLGVLSLPEVAIVGEEGTVYLRTVNSKMNDSSDSFSIEVGKADKNFSAVFKSENLKLMQKDYTISLSFKGLAQFKADNILYIVPCEASSSF